MAMTMNGEVQLAAPREAVWAKLNDPEVLKACIPGCEELEKTDDNGFRAVAKMKVGPVSARFKGKVTLSDLDPPNGYRISGEGEGGVAGFAKGGATVGARRQGWRHAADLQCRGPDRRQAGPARPAPDQRLGQETGRRIFRQFRQGRAGLIPADSRAASHACSAMPRRGAPGCSLPGWPILWLWNDFKRLRAAQCGSAAEESAVWPKSP